MNAINNEEKIVDTFSIYGEVIDLENPYNFYGKGWTYDYNKKITINKSGNYILTGTTDYITVDIAASSNPCNVTFNKLHMKLNSRKPNDECNITVLTGTDCNFIVDGLNTIENRNYSTAIKVEPNASVNFVSKSSDPENILNIYGAVAIGSDYTADNLFGNIRVQDANINAYGRIGLGINNTEMYSSIGTFKMYGGTLNVTGWAQSSDGCILADIIKISGGTVYVNNKNGYEPAIGFARGSQYNQILINQNARVTAIGGLAGAGIDNKGYGGSIDIEGGIITAYGGPGAAGIGTGDYYELNNYIDTYSRSIRISGGHVTAYGGKSSTGNTKNGGAGIGSGRLISSGNITITSGNIFAYGMDGGAGIGAGYQGFKDHILIFSDAKIEAVGDSLAHDIGSGSYRSYSFNQYYSGLYSGIYSGRMSGLFRGHVSGLFSGIVVRHNRKKLNAYFVGNYSGLVSGSYSGLFRGFYSGYLAKYDY